MKIKTFVLGPLNTNCHVVACAKTGETMIIDPADEPEQIMTTLKENSWEATHIFLTHAHVDHLGGVAKIKESTGATISLHRGEMPVLQNVELQATFLGLPAPQAFVPDRFVADGEKIQIGALEFIVLETPGHTPGGVSLLSGQCVFVGDVLFAGSIGRTDLPGGSQSVLMRSICDRLMVLSDDTVVYSGHGPNTTVGVERIANPFIECR